MRFFIDQLLSGFSSPGTTRQNEPARACQGNDDHAGFCMTVGLEQYPSTWMGEITLTPWNRVFLSRQMIPFARMML
jgi:hypothetical protein